MDKINYLFTGYYYYYANYMFFCCNKMLFCCIVLALLDSLFFKVFLFVVSG